MLLGQHGHPGFHGAIVQKGYQISNFLSGNNGGSSVKDLGANRRFFSKQATNTFIDAHNPSVSFVSKDVAFWLIYPDFEDPANNEDLGCTKISNALQVKFKAIYGESAKIVHVNLDNEENVEEFEKLITAPTSIPTSTPPIEID